jgi:hypothetical protein
VATDALSLAFTYISANVEISVSLASMLTAVCAFAMTFYHFSAVRRHNSIAVKPYLTTFCMKQEDLENNIVTIEWSLSNDGLGPAIISSYQILLDGSFVDTDKRQARDVLLLFTKVFGQRLKRPISFIGLSKDTIIAKEKSKPIIAVELSTTPVSNIKNTKELNEFTSGIERFEVVVHYKSFYGEKSVLRAFGG